MQKIVTNLWFDGRVEEALELVDVVAQHRHERAGAPLLVVGELEPLEVAVRIHPEVVLDGLGEVPPEKRVEVLEDRLQNPDHEGDRREEEELVPDLAHPEGGEKGVLPLHDDVHRRADEGGRAEIEDLVQHRAGRGEEHPAPVGPRVPDQAAERVPPGLHRARGLAFSHSSISIGSRP